MLCKHYGALTQILVRLHEHGGAMSAVADLAAIFPERPEAPYDAACCLARCLPLVEHDEQLSASLREQWGATYADKALAFLREANQKGFKDVELLRNNPELARLRSHPGFQHLVAERQTSQPNP